MKDIHPIYARPLDIRVDKLHVRRIALNRHLPEALWVEEHSHSHSQLLLYLTGHGCQKVRGKRHSTETGSLFYFPPRTPHAFLEETGRKPLCLALDIDLAEQQRLRAVHGKLNALELHSARGALSRLTRWKDETEPVDPADAAEVLLVVDVLLRAAGLLRRRRERLGGSLLQRVQRHVALPENRNLPLAALAGRIGYGPYYLNRQLKASCGLTLGQLRASHQLAEARALLGKRENIADAAAELGFEDPNYFSRWSRKLTGQTPSEYRKLVELGGSVRRPSCRERAGR